MPTRSYWTTRPNRPRFPRLDKNLAVDVAVIGGGLTGVTAAYLLHKAGLSTPRTSTATSAGSRATCTRRPETRAGPWSAN